MTAEELLLQQSLTRAAKRLGLDPDELVFVYQKQEGRCKICQETGKRGWGGLVPDFDYNTEKLRGFLCQKHKTGLACFGESADMLKAASDYLASI
jgi:recombination endonuclease VII